MSEKYNIPEKNSLDSMEGVESRDAVFDKIYLNFITHWKHRFLGIENIETEEGMRWLTEIFKSDFYKFVGKGVEYTEMADILRYKNLVKKIADNIRTKHASLFEKNNNNDIISFLNSILTSNDERISFLENPDSFFPDNFTEEYPLTSERLYTEEFKLYFYDYINFCEQSNREPSRVKGRDKKTIAGEVLKIIEELIRRHDIEREQKVTIKNELLSLFYIEVLAYYTQNTPSRVRETLLPYQYSFTFSGPRSSYDMFGTCTFIFDDNLDETPDKK